jgi:hypothetical protein
VSKFAPGWKVRGCGRAENPGLRENWDGRKNVLVTHPLDRNTGCILSRTLDIPANKKTVLRLVVGHDRRGDWTLIIRGAGKELARHTVSRKSARDRWMTVEHDLSTHAGSKLDLELANEPNGWAYETGFWAEIRVESR